MKIEDEEKADLFREVIQELADKHMVRSDYVENIDVDSILAETPYNFPYTAI